MADCYGLRRMRSNCVRACYFLYGHLATDRAKPMEAEIVRKSCDAGAVGVQSPQSQYGNRTTLSREAVLRWCVDCARAVRSPCDFFSQMTI